MASQVCFLFQIPIPPVVAQKKNSGPAEKLSQKKLFLEHPKWAYYAGNLKTQSTVHYISRFFSRVFLITIIYFHYFAPPPHHLASCEGFREFSNEILTCCFCRCYVSVCIVLSFDVLRCGGKGDNDYAVFRL